MVFAKGIELFLRDHFLGNQRSTVRHLDTARKQSSLQGFDFAFGGNQQHLSRLGLVQNHEGFAGCLIFAYLHDHLIIPLNSIPSRLGACHRAWFSIELTQSSLMRIGTKPNLADVEHLDFKLQVFACQWMVSIHSNPIAIDVGDTYFTHPTLFVF